MNDEPIELNEEDLDLVAGGVFIGAIFQGVAVGITDVPGFTNVSQTDTSISFTFSN